MPKPGPVRKLWFAIGGRFDDLLAGYGLLMVVAQVRLLPAYRRLRFSPGFWSFTFSWASVGFAGLSWLGITHPSGWRLESYLVLALISVFIRAIAVRTAVALRRGELIPLTRPLEVTRAAVAPRRHCPTR